MSEDALDKAAGVRDGESLNETALADWLTAHVTGLEGPLEVRQFPGGFSNLTYLLKFGERELVMRRPPFGANIKSAHDMGREYRVLSGLKDVYPLVPTPLAHCEDNQVIGVPFYVMERIKGVILRAGSKPLAAEQFSELSAAFVENLADSSENCSAAECIDVINRVTDQDRITAQGRCPHDSETIAPNHTG